MKNRFLVYGFVLAALVLAAACSNPSGGGSPEKAVEGVTIDPVTKAVPRGGSLKFTAAVEVLGGASANVEWTVTGRNIDGETLAETVVDCDPDTNITSDSADADAKGKTTATLLVAPEETAAALIVRVTSKENPAKSAEARITLNDEPVVNITITIQEGGAINLNQGGTATLHAEAEGYGLTDEEKNSITWTIQSEHKEGTVIGTDGVLKIAGDEPLGDLAIRAAYGKDPGKYAEITVTVLDKNAAAVVSVTVSAAAASVGPGGTVQFTADVTVKNGAPKDVTWTVTGNGKPGTTISAAGLLTVAADETAKLLTVTAASAAPGFTNIKSAGTTVAVSAGSGNGDIYLIGTDFGAWADPTKGQVMTKGGNTYTWTGTMNKDSTFKFRDDTVTGWANGTWYVAEGNNVPTAGAEAKKVKKAGKSDDGGAWLTAATGKYTITLNTTNSTVTFTPIPEVTGVTVKGSGTALKGSNNNTYTAEVTVTHGAAATVTWSVSGGTGTTAISAAGVLTVDANETATTLTVKAASTVDETKTGTFTVTVAKGDIYLIGTDFGAWADPTKGQVMTKGGNTYTWTGTMNKDSTFKFRDDTVTGWANGTWYVAEGNNVPTAGAEAKKVKRAGKSDDGGAWLTAASGKYKIDLDTAALTVTFTPIPEVTKITVTGPDTAVKGKGTTYTATVTATHGATTVTWSVSGGTGTPAIDGGVLTVAADETAATLTITATSTVDNTKSGTKTVNVTSGGNMYLIGNDFGGWPSPDPSATSGQMMNKSGNTYTWTGLMSKGSTFKFHDDTITGWNDGNWFNAPDANQATTNNTHNVGIAVGSETGKDWKTSHGGQYTITLDTANSQVTFSSTEQVITITGGPSALAPGETNGTFTWTTTITDASAPVTWAVSGDNQNHTDALQSNGTGIVDGILTLGSGEWIGHTLYVTATSLGETVQNTDYPVLAVPVIDAAVYIVGPMNSWNYDGTLMNRGTTDTTKHLFTWTGNVSGDYYFKMHWGGGSNEWRAYFAPISAGTYEINEGHRMDISVDRWASPGDNNASKQWKITPWGDGQYTITFNAAAKTLTVTKSP